MRRSDHELYHGVATIRASQFSYDEIPSKIWEELEEKEEEWRRNVRVSIVLFAIPSSFILLSSSGRSLVSVLAETGAAARAWCREIKMADGHDVRGAREQPWNEVREALVPPRRVHVSLGN